MAKFRTTSKTVNVPESPSTLFHDLSDRSDTVKYLWAHQKELLDTYHAKHLDTKDVALELPTGAGKTLVGLLVAEFRRRAKGERVAYLCPTRQLARQVGDQAAAYGINAHVFIGAQAKYDPSQFTSYQRAEAIAITTYSGVFNVNPRIDRPQVLIFDDAHSCESYVTGMWSIEIDRSDNLKLYQEFIRLFGDWLPDSFHVSDGDDGYARTELIPGQVFRNASLSVLELLNEHLEPGSAPHYALSLLKDHLHACLCFISHNLILIRPIVPPTQTHPPFSQARQRLYMSATLGHGGELERIVGVPQIERIPIPAEWETHGSGRRLFLLPELSLEEDKAIELTISLIKQAGRAVVLSPTQRKCADIEKLFDDTGLTVFTAKDIEDGLEGYAGTSDAVLVLSRYDGIDLPDDDCRFLVFAGKPAGANLQEHFLMSRVAAAPLLRDRILTRVTQGVGRCTRSDQDYAAVVLLGQDIVDFLVRSENSALLHPELQAELEFGINNSKQDSNDDSVDFSGLLQEFLRRTRKWKEADDYIQQLRKSKCRTKDEFTTSLRNSVEYEVKYLYAAWDGHWEHARDHAKSALEALDDGNQLAGYQGWWMYLCGDAELAIGGSQAERRGQEYFGQAARQCPSLSWLSKLVVSHRSTHDASTEAEADPVLAECVENIVEQLKRWGFHGKTFTDKVKVGLAMLDTDSHKEFHQGLEFVGRILGWTPDRPTGDGDPDCIWKLGRKLYIAFEAKSEQNHTGEIGKKDVQQAQGHVAWIEENCSPLEDATIIPVLVTPRTSLAASAKPHADGLYVTSVDAMRELGRVAVDAAKKVRNAIAAMDELEALNITREKLEIAELTPDDIVDRLKATPLIHSRE